jgi:hypothetical protein
VETGTDNFPPRGDGDEESFPDVEIFVAIPMQEKTTHEGTYTSKL